MDSTVLLAAAQKRVSSTLATTPQQLESASESLVCVLLSSMDGDDQLEFHLDRSVFRHVKSQKHALAFNAAELVALLVSCSASASSCWSVATSKKVLAVLHDARIEQILESSASALVCTLAEPVAAAAWTRPAVKLAVLASFLFPALELAETHRCIFGVYVQADERRCDSLCTATADNPPHTMLKTQIAEALVSVFSSVG